MSKKTNTDDDLQKMIDAKRKAFREFDAKPISEQRRLREQGLDPHERPEIRKAKKRRFLAKYKMSLPVEVRKALTAIGWFSDSDEIITRETGTIHAKK